MFVPGTVETYLQSTPTCFLVSFGSRMLKQRIPSALHFSLTLRFLRDVRRD